jgi:glycosyltransferase involved in cell wall biosynthesis
MSPEPLRILVYPHDMAMGGSQLNAIDLAAAVRDLGHQVTVIGASGALVQRVRELELPYLAVPDWRRRPSLTVARQLRGLVRTQGFDIVHGYEWPPGLEAAASVFPSGRSAAVCTVMSMAVAPFLPRRLPLVVGTRALRDHTAARRSGPVHVIEPPVDVELNAPDHPVGEFRDRYGLSGATTIVTVCRLVPEQKLEGLLTAVDVVGELATRSPVRLVVVGDGPARDAIAERAAKANATAGREAVTLTGELLDPRPAYAAADLVLGMGSSALRALAFARTLVVQGELGFWRLLTPDSAELFLRQGWYGVGDGTGGHERLAAILREVVADPDRRASLGGYGRRLVEERFSLRTAAGKLLDVYREALARKRSVLREAADGSRSAGGVFGYKVRQKYRGWRGTRATDDFGTVALARAALSRDGLG